MTFYKARAGRERAGFRSWFLHDYSKRLLEPPYAGRCIVNLVDVTPAKFPWQRPGEAEPIPAVPAYDVVSELWLESGMRPQWPPGLNGWCEAPHGYVVSETVEKDRQAVAPGERSPGAKYIALCLFHDDLSPAAAQRRWSHHVGLALRVHVGMSKYVRNWVAGQLGDAAPRAQGIVELHFPTLVDLEERWFESDAGRAQITQDVGHFLKSGNRMFTSEYVLREA